MKTILLLLFISMVACKPVYIAPEFAYSLKSYDIYNEDCLGESIYTEYSKSGQCIQRDGGSSRIVCMTDPDGTVSWKYDIYRYNPYCSSIPDDTLRGISNSCVDGEFLGGYLNIECNSARMIVPSTFLIFITITTMII